MLLMQHLASLRHTFYETIRCQYQVVDPNKMSGTGDLDNDTEGSHAFRMTLSGEYGSFKGDVRKDRYLTGVIIAKA